MGAWRWAALAALWATSALAQDLGDGHQGDLTIDTPKRILNRDGLALTHDVHTGETELPVAGSTMAYYPGDLLLLIRIRGGTSDGSETGQAGEAGDYFFTRISHINLEGFEINPPFERDWSADNTEIVSALEYRNFTITSTGSLYAPTWNGTTGGVVVLLVTDELRIDGSLNADAIGFRGGLAGGNGFASGLGCLNPNEPAPNGAQKGEGMLLTSWDGTFTGFGRNANGGGGGVCQSSGGGGGGNFGKGGAGGASTDGLRPVGGQGGAAIITAGFKPLFGGGGGAGTRDSTLDGSSGGTGGGIVIVRAGHISGSGTISADGADALTGPAESATNWGSPGGGGAGGSVDIVSVRDPTCHVSVKGGNGGLPAGGGGAGGRVRFAAPNADGCTADLQAGVGGSSMDKHGEPQSPQAQGYVGQVIVETLNETVVKVPNRYEFGTLGCSGFGGGWIGVLIPLLLRRRR